MSHSARHATACALYEAVRPYSTFIGAAGASASLLVTAPGLAPSSHLLMFVVVALAMAGGFLFNDVFDLPQDKINAPHRPIPSGRLTPGLARFFGATALVGAVLLSVPFGWAPVVLVAINAILLWGYSYLRIWHGVIGNIVTAYFGASVIVLGGLVGVWDSKLIPSTVFIFGLLLLREFAFDIKDRTGDQAVGLRTLATLRGPLTAFRAIYFTGITVAGSMVYFCLDGWIARPSVFLPFTLIAIALSLIPLARFQRQQTDGNYRHFYRFSKFGLLLSIPGLVLGSF